MNLPKNPIIAFAGSVNSSRVVLTKLIEHNMNVVLALGLDPLVSKNVSGFNDLKPIANAGGLNFKYFKKLNEDWVFSEIETLKVDLFFVIGLSQLVRPKLLNLPKHGCIGYHPTLLPQGRGRAAIAWIILGEANPAVSFFKMDEGADSGPILTQEKVAFSGKEYPQDLIDKIVDQIGIILDRFLPNLMLGLVSYTDQDESKATYLGKRTPSDGYINWSQSAEDIEKRIRCVSHPLPGAFTYLKNKKIVIWKSRVSNNCISKGVDGSIVILKENSFVVQVGTGHLEITDFTGISLIELREGMKLGMDFISLYDKMINQ
jgi:methionyl-tRNA formyltransferase